VNLTEGQIEQVLKYLSVENPAPVIRQSYKWSRTRCPIVWTRPHSAPDQKRELEWQEVQGYVDTSDCLMAYLEWTLDDPHAATVRKVCPIASAGRKRAGVPGGPGNDIHKRLNMLTHTTQAFCC